MLILTRRHEQNPTRLFKLDHKDIIEVRTPDDSVPTLVISRPGCPQAVPLAEYSTEDRAEEVLAQMARFSSQLMRTPQMDPLFIMPLDTEAQQE